MVDEEEVEAFRDEVRSFLERELDPVIEGQGPFPQMDTPEKRAFVAKLVERGWLGLTWPIEVGGGGKDELFQLVLQEELEYLNMPSMAIEVGMVGQTMLRHASAAMCAELLPPILRGEVSIALGYSEPQAGSDLAALELRAVPDGDDFVLNGQKMWTSGAHFADLIWLACRTNTQVPRHQGISLFLADLDGPGIEVQEIKTMGDHRTNMVFFTDVRVPRSRLVGELDRGWAYIVDALDYERLRGIPFGGLQRDLDELVHWATVEGRWDDERTRTFIARQAVRVAGARTHLDRAMALVSRHEVPTVEATMLKVALTEARQDLADGLIDLVGPPALLKAGEPGAALAGRFEHTWRAEIITSIAGGANEIQRNILARRHLGLPGG
jgi:hypothetical protein